MPPCNDLQIVGEIVCDAFNNANDLTGKIVCDVPVNGNVFLGATVWMYI